MSKHKRLLRLAKLVGGTDHWACVWHPQEHEDHIANWIDRAREYIKELEQTIRYLDKKTCL